MADDMEKEVEGEEEAAEVKEGGEDAEETMA